MVWDEYYGPDDEGSLSYVCFVASYVGDLGYWALVASLLVFEFYSGWLLLEFCLVVLKLGCFGLWLRVRGQEGSKIC